MSTYRSFFKNNLVVLSGQLLLYAQGVILMPIIIKTIGVRVYGGYGILVSIIGFVVGISSFGVGFRRSRFLPSARDTRERQDLFFPQFYFHLASLMLLSLGLIFLYPTLDKIFFKGDVSFFIWLAVPYCFFYLLYSQTVDYFRYTHRIGYFNFFTLLFSFLNIALILLLYYFAFSLTINVLFSIQIAVSLSVALPLVFKTIKEIGLRWIIPTWNSLVEDIKLGFPLILVYIVDFVLNSSDRYVIAAFISITAVGYYNSAYALGSFIILLPKISGVVLPPFIAKAVDTGKEDEARIMVNYTVKGFLLAAIPFVVGSAVLSKPLLIIFANSEVANNAYLVTPIVALGALFYGLNIILSNVLFVRLKTVMLFKMNFLAAILNLGLNLLIFYFIPNILVAAISTFLSYFIAFIFVHRAVTVDWPLDYDMKTIMKSGAAALCMALGLLAAGPWLAAGGWRLTTVLEAIVLGSVIYVVALLLLGTFSRREWLKLKEFVFKGDRAVGK